MLRLFSICEATRWTHLPVAGGLYDQNPRFIEKLHYMLVKKGEAEEKKNKKEARTRPTPKARNR